MNIKIKNQHSLSLIIPAYNEEESIEAAVLVNIEVLQRAEIEFEIIIIDDGSKDKTKGIIEEKFAGKPNLIFFSKPNGGFGSAVRKGIELSSRDYVMFVPVDSPLNENTLSSFLMHANKADIIVSYRMERKGYSNRMKVNSSIYHKLISFLFGLSLKDYNWIHLYNRKIFDKITIENGRIFMLAEVLIKAKRLGYTFYEFPIEMEERTSGDRTAASYKAALQTFFDTIRFFFKRK
ncbi:MAG: glycosyltransferase family 2 protein [Bacteroidia bacterium]|nr:glycosyltransferase family 2 protein [Bacteroidia bacterium]